MSIHPIRPASSYTKTAEISQIGTNLQKPDNTGVTLSRDTVTLSDHLIFNHMQAEFTSVSVSASTDYITTAYASTDARQSVSSSETTFTSYFKEYIKIIEQGKQSGGLYGTNVFANDLGAIENAKTQISQSIQQLLKQNGIAVDQSFQMTVDPYDFYIHIDGIDDAALTKSIEDAINCGDNGKNLYYLIEAENRLKTNVGYSPAEKSYSLSTFKTALFHSVKQFTGYDIRTLERKNNTFYTPDGRDLWEVMTTSLPSDETGQIACQVNELRGIYVFLSQYGWDAIGDACLDIGFQNGVLTPIDEILKQKVMERTCKF